MKQKELHKLLNSSLRDVAKEHNWKCSRGFVFRATDQLFFVVLVNGQAKHQKLHYSLSYKWLEFDDLFWSIVDLDDNRRQPLSFRAAGAWVAPTMKVSCGQLPIDEWEKTLIDSTVDTIVSECNRNAEKISEEIDNLDDNLIVVERLYAQLLEEHPNAIVNIWRERLLTSILKGNRGEAAEIALARLDDGDIGGFSVGAKSFYALAEQYIQQNQH